MHKKIPIWLWTGEDLSLKAFSTEAGPVPEGFHSTDVQSTFCPQQDIPHVPLASNHQESHFTAYQLHNSISSNLQLFTRALKGQGHGDGCRIVKPCVISPILVPSSLEDIQLSSSLALRSRVGFRAKVGSGRPALGEESREYWMNEGSEDDLGATCLGKCHPQDEDELECVVEGYSNLVVERACVIGATYGTSKPR